MVSDVYVSEVECVVGLIVVTGTCAAAATCIGCVDGICLCN